MPIVLRRLRSQVGTGTVAAGHGDSFATRDVFTMRDVARGRPARECGTTSPGKSQYALSSALNSDLLTACT